MGFYIYFCFVKLTGHSKIAEAMSVDAWLPDTQTTINTHADVSILGLSNYNIYFLT